LGLSTEFQVPLAFQSGVDQEEDKKEVYNNDVFEYHDNISEVGGSLLLPNILRTNTANSKEVYCLFQARKI
jgi:hypothetical protein